MNRIITSTLKKFMFIGFFSVIVYYQSFHYILQYTSSGTSPSYTNTPFVWQGAKYLILTCFVIIIYMFSQFKKTNSLSVYVLLWILISLVLINLVDKFNNISELKYIYLFILLSPMLFFNKITLNNLFAFFTKSLDTLVIFFIISNIYVIVNFFVFNHLPAQAYAGSLAVRFAGFYDMPNGFGVLNVFLFFYNMYYKKNKRIISFMLLVNILLTASISSFLTFMAVYVILNKSLKTAIIICLTIISLILIYYTFQDFFYTLYMLKKGSINAHLEMLEHIVLMPILKEGHLVFNESFVISFFTNYFPFSILVFLLYFKLLINNKNNLFGLYLLIFFISNLFIPNMYIFPNNIIFILTIIFILRKKDLSANYDRL